MTLMKLSIQSKAGANRIAMLSPESMISSIVGGLARVTSGLSTALVGRGTEIHLFTGKDEGQEDYEFLDGVHVHRCGFSRGSDILEGASHLCGAWVSRLHEVENWAGKFDLAHAHDWMTVDFLHQLKNEGYPTVLTFHSTEYGRNGGQFGDWREFREISGKEWYGGYIADRVTAVSSFLKRELMWLYNVPEWKIDVIPNGIGAGRFKKDVDPGRIKERYGIHPLAPVVLFVGRMEHQKGPDLLVKAIPRVLSHRWDAKFIILGRGNMLDYIKKLASDLGIMGSTRILGYVSEDEYIDILNACDIVCIPSRNEPFGLVLLEAWDAEKAVVAANVGGLDKNIDNFVNGIKVFTSPESIAWGINYIIDDPEGVSQLGARGKEKARGWTWDKVVSEYEKAYAKLLCSP